MKKCVVVTRFAKNQPGYLDFAYRIEALATRFQVLLVSDHPLAVPEMRIEGVEQHVVKGGASQWGWFRYLWNAARFVRRQRPDCVVLLHTMVAPLVYLLGDTPTALYWNEHAVRLKATKGAGPLKRLYQAWRHRFLFMGAVKRVQLLLPIGEAHRDDLLAHGCRPERTTLIYMGVDARFRGVAMNRKREEDAPLELIYTGTVQKARGRDVMIEAVALAREDGVPVHLTMVGASEEERDHCVSYAARLGISDALSVHGRVPGREIPEFIAQADAGICLWEDQPWWRFNPPTKLFEYLAAGLPVLASNIRTHTQYVSHGNNGLIFEYDSASLAGTLRDLWQKRGELPDYKIRALECSTPYLWENIEPVFLRSIEGLVCN